MVWAAWCYPGRSGSPWPPFLRGWFTNDPSFCSKGLLSSKRNHHVLIGSWIRGVREVKVKHHKHKKTDPCPFWWSKSPKEKPPPQMTFAAVDCCWGLRKVMGWFHNPQKRSKKVKHFLHMDIPTMKETFFSMTQLFIESKLGMQHSWYDYWVFTCQWN